MDKADIGSDDNSTDCTTGIDINSVIVIKSIGISITRCCTVVFTEEGRSIKGNISASTITSKSQDIAVIKSENRVSLILIAFWLIAVLSAAIKQLEEASLSRVLVAYRSVLEIAKCPAFLR